MPKNFNTRAARRVSYLLSALVFAGATGCGLGLTNEARLERAQEAYDAGEFRAAIIDLRNVLQQEPDNAEARVLLGRAAIRAADPATAEKEFRRALDLGIPLEAIAVDLGQAMLQLGQFNEFLDQIQPEVSADRIRRVELLRMRADATMGLQLPGSARDIYLEVLESDPSDMQARMGVVATYVSQGEYGNARSAISDAAAIDEGYAPLWLASGSLHLTQDNPVAAVTDFDRAKELAASSGSRQDLVRAQIGLVEAHLANEELSAAKSSAAELLELAPDNLIARYLSARLAFLDGEFESAQATLQEVLSAAPEYRPAQLLMGAVHLQRGNLGQAEMHLSAVVAASPDQVDARRLLAETRLRQNRAEEAAEVLRPVLAADDPNIAALGLAVRASIASGDYDNAIGYLERSLEVNPDSVERKLDLASAYLAAGRAQDAEALLDSVPDDGGEASYRRDLLTVMTPLRRDDPASALQYANEMATGWPEDAGIRNLIGGIEFSMGRLEDARDAFIEAKDLAPQNPAAYVNLARIDLREGKLASAKEWYLAALEHAPDSARLMTALAQIEARSEDRDAAIEWLQKARSADPQALGARVLLARVFLDSGDYDAAVQLAEEALVLAETNAEIHNILGLALRGAGDNARAISSFERAAELDPESADDYRMNVARAQLAQGNDALAEDALRELEDHDAESSISGAVLLASIKARQGRFDEAMKIAEDLKERFPNSGIPLALEGELHASQGEFGLAATAYEQALELREEDRRLVLRAFRVRTRGGIDNPEQPLVRYLEKRPLDSDVRLLVAQAYQAEGKSGYAIREYERLLGTDPDRFVALNNLAWEYFQIGDPRAEEVAKRAFDLSPGNGAVADTLGWIQASNGNLEEGIATLRRAVQLSNGRAQVKYHLAAALAMAGEPDEARQLLEDILDSDVEFSSRAAAEELLATL